MQFTPQQLAGGPKYSPVTRIGNWQEEIALEESKIDNFKKRSAAGSLSLKKMESKISSCSEIVPHSFSPDGFIRFGDSVILRHDDSGSILACDPYEYVAVGPETYLVTTTAENPTPKARNTFNIARPPRKLQDVTDREDDPILHVGQPFVLTCNESLLVQSDSNLLAPMLYLSSTKKNERTATKRSNRQMVYMTTLCDADSIWYASVPSKGKINGTERFLAVGTPVSVGTSYQFTHRQTNMYLTCDPHYPTNTEFGIEYECYADRSTATGKISLMVSEFKGLSTSQTLTKPDAQSFSWHFVVSNDAAKAVDTRNLPPVATNDTILSTLRQSIISRGVDAFWNLRDFLKSLERQLVTGGKLDRVDLKAALIQWGISLNPRYLDTVLDMVDTGDMGLIEVRDFMNLVRGEIPANRQASIDTVFESLDVENVGSVPVEQLRNRFVGDNHPLVSLGGYSSDFALDHMMKCFESNRRLPSKVNRAMFLDYYGDLSACVDDDEYFLSIVRSNWM